MNWIVITPRPSMVVSALRTMFLVFAKAMGDVAEYFGHLRRFRFAEAFEFASIRITRWRGSMNWRTV